MRQNTKSKGEATEASIIAALLQSGFSVSLPFGNNQRYDLIVDNGRRLLKAQCKTGRVRNGVVIFNTSSSNSFTGKRSTYRGQVDMFLVFAPEIKTFYWVPVKGTGIVTTSLRLGKTSRRKCRWAKDFEFKAGVPQSGL